MGKSFDSHVWINTGKDTDKLLGAEFIIMYDPARLKYVSSEPQNGYMVLNDVVDDGKGTLTLKMVTLGTEKAGAVDILKVTFQLLAMDRENRRAIGMSGEIFVTGQTTNWVLNNGHPSFFGPETLPSGVPTAVPTTIPTTIPTTVPTGVITRYACNTANKTCSLAANGPYFNLASCETACIVPTGVPTAVPTAVSGTKILGDANGVEGVNMIDFDIWKREYLGILETKSADWGGEVGIVDMIDFDIWKRAYLAN